MLRESLIPNQVKTRFPIQLIKNIVLCKVHRKRSSRFYLLPALEVNSLLPKSLI